MRGSKSLVGFMLGDWSEDYKSYLTNLIGLVASGKMKIVVDLGHTSPGGPFEGINSVVRGEEVRK